MLSFIIIGNTPTLHPYLCLMGLWKKNALYQMPTRTKDPVQWSGHLDWVKL